MDDISWIYNLKKDVPDFLRKLKGRSCRGFFHYSLSGDYWPESVKWGLGNTVFFLKIVYTLGLEEIFASEAEEAKIFIKKFQKKNGEISDTFLHLVALPFLLRTSILEKKMQDFSLKQVRRAETRQAFCALNLFGDKPELPYSAMPADIGGIDKYLSDLDWSAPWGAGSHFSHLVFFLNQSEQDNKKELISYAIDWVNAIQKEDGFWYKGLPDDAQKINGAMKVITALKVADMVTFAKAEKIIDLCLSSVNDRQACDNFNITYVLKYCFEVTGGNYRKEEISAFMFKRLAMYKEYYHDEAGGFSFKKNKANRFYYGSLISRGRNEPDIHGTVMFLWGIAVIAQVLGFDKELGFKEFIT